MIEPDSIKTGRPAFPPPYRPFAVTADLDPFERGLVLAADGADPGTLLWRMDDGVGDCAIVLAPENPVEESLPVVLVAMLGVGDALGVLLPPVVAVTFGWPDRVDLNGGTVGGVRMAVAPTPSPTAIPDWLVIGFRLANKGDWRSAAGKGRQQTTLAAEGCEIETLDLLEGFSRHFLAWIHRWQTDGNRPVLQAWSSRAVEIGQEVVIEADDSLKRGVFRGLTPTGGIELASAGRTQIISLDRATRTPSWAA
jgi:biotin-(acetyl-CoA carboxylase) ligase